ncbi:MAG: sodium:solute symporter family protein [Candidatus Eisenbacteria bacterium]|nr:sodium:solute symporter family protein [Candidatus Eisenbacteria bacterium]
MSGPRPSRLGRPRVSLVDGGGGCDMRAAVTVAYLAAILAVGVIARRRRGGDEAFFLAGRTLGPLILLATMAATNFSGFTVLGFSGAGYRLGFAFYPVMAYGTGLMALSFLLIGVPAWRLGRRMGLITPPELLTIRYGSRPLSVAFGAAMAVFTLPYLAIQPMAAGYAMEGILGLPYEAGAGLATALVLVYVLLGGLRAVARTDVIQGAAMTALLAAGLFVVARASGGFAAGLESVADGSPEHFCRPGAGGGLAVGVWASYMLLWFLADPMFPQLFQRFYAARGERSILRTMSLYPIMTGALFFLPVAIGVLGRLHFPGLAESETDQILPLLMDRFGGDWLPALAVAGLLGAILSTMDSQLLTLGSIVERDLLGLRAAAGREGATGRRRAGPAARVTVAVLAVAGYLLALRPPATILAIATETFAGLAVLFPVVVAAIYWPRATSGWSLASILAGESAVVLYHFGLLPGFGLLPAIPAVAVSAAVLGVGGLVTREARPLPAFWREETTLPLARQEKRLWAGLFLGFFILSVDWWRFGSPPRLVAGMPVWIFYFFGLCALLSIAYLALARRLAGKGRAARQAVPPLR